MCTQAQQAAKLTISALKAISMVGEATDAIMPPSYSFASAFDYHYHVTLPDEPKASAGTADLWWCVQDLPYFKPIVFY